MYLIGIDVGGTFTDLVSVDEGGRVVIAKSPSTPDDPSLGVVDGLARLAEALGIARERLLAETGRIVHGTTVATNSLLQRRGPRLALLTTEGHRDVLEMREGLKWDRYDLRLARPDPLVPRELRLGIVERMRADGEVEIPLDTASVDRAIRRLKRARVEAVAITFLHAYLDDSHERETAARVRAALPEIYVSISSEIFPRIKEFERVSTTVVNAYVGPTLEGYLDRLGGRLAELGCEAPILIIQSHGGVVPIREATRVAAGAILSGPAGGVAGARASAGLLGHADLIPFDMGGTSTDISLIVDGEPTLAADRGIAGERIALPSLDIVTLGAGGGSIAAVDPGGVLQVGPGSAGAVPGPVCYGQGGTAATVTDANLVLGYLDPGNFLGGRVRLDTDAAEAALDRLGADIGLDRVAAAAGVHRVVNTKMAEGIRLAAVRRGVDPRRFALLAFGGAAGLHGTDLARQLDITRVVVPRAASVLSAWGMLASDLRFEVARTHIGDMGRLDASVLRTLYGELEARAGETMRGWHSGEISFQRSADMRYGEQVFEIDVPLDAIEWDGPDQMGQIAQAFHARHEELFTYALPDSDVVLVNAKLAAVGAMATAPTEPEIATGAPAPPATRRQIHLDGPVEVPIFALADVVAGQEIPGPAIVESPTTTVLLRPGDNAEVTPLGWLDIGVAGRSMPN